MADDGTDLVFEGIDTADPDIRTRLRFAATDLPEGPSRS